MKELKKICVTHDAALEPVKRILEEADKAINDRGSTIATSDIPEVLGGIAGGAIGGGFDAGLRIRRCRHQRSSQ